MKLDGSLCRGVIIGVGNGVCRGFYGEVRM